MALNFTIRNLSQTEDEKTFHVEQTEIKRVVNVGATYTPAVSEEGVISWTNDQELPNPAPVNIKGPVGPAPAVTVSKVGKVATVTIGTETFTLTDGADGAGTGDMLKATYDINNNGIVDNAEKLGGKSASEFAAAVHGHEISDVNGLQAKLNTIPAAYTLPKATRTSLGGVRIIGALEVDSTGQVWIRTTNESAKRVGIASFTNSDGTEYLGIYCGDGLEIDSDGKLKNAYSMTYSNGTLAITGPS